MSDRFDLALTLAQDIHPLFSPFDLHRYYRHIGDPPPVTLDEERMYQATAVFQKVLSA